MDSGIGRLLINWNPKAGLYQGVGGVLTSGKRGLESPLGLGMNVVPGP